MRSRKRLLGALRGETIDRTPWSPFLAYYFDSLPQDIREKGQFEYLRQMGADPLLRGFHRLTRCIFEKCEIQQKTAGREQYVTYHPPLAIWLKSMFILRRGIPVF